MGIDAVRTLGPDGQPFSSGAALPVGTFGDGIADSTNSTTANLGSSATYTGTWYDITEFAGISVTLSGTVAGATGTLKMEFSTDASAVIRSIQIPILDLTAEPPHTLARIAKWFRVVYVNDSTAQTTFNLTTLYHKSPIKLTSRLTDQVTDATDVDNVRAFIGGQTDGGATKIVNVDQHGDVMTHLHEPATVYGEVIISEATPIFQKSFSYGINPRVVDTYTTGSGTTSGVSRMARLSTTAATSSKAQIKSKRLIHHEAGQGSGCKFTAVYTTGVANSSQCVGAGDETNGFFFGYDGATFGVLLRSGGAFEVRTLTVTAKSTDAENITITLDSNALATVAVTDQTAGTVNDTAAEIAAADYSGVGDGWDAYQVDDTVLFVSMSTATQGGTYSLSSATSATGTFAQTVAAATATDTWTAQTAFTDDKLDGTADATNNPSGVNFDPTLFNEYEIDFSDSNAQFYVRNPNGEMIRAHTLQYVNQSGNVTPPVENFSFPIMAMVENTTNSTAIVVDVGSIEGFIDGGENDLGIPNAIQGARTGTETVFESIVAIRNRKEFNGVTNESVVVIRSATYAAEASGSNTSEVEVVKNPVWAATGPDPHHDWSEFVSGESCVDVSTSQVDLSSGDIVGGDDLPKSGRGRLDFKGADRVELSPGESAAVVIRATGGSVSSSATLNITELQ
jgi:hypothetical protein